jgi:DNA-binding transcriptional ArsR family regulator
VADIYHALSAEARRLILDELNERDSQSLYEICTRLIMKHEMSLSRQAVSQHLDVLEEAGLISTRREGRYKFHHINTEPLAEIAKRWPRTSQQEQ